MPVALFGIEDGSLNLAVNLLLLVLVVVWLSLVYWTFADARRRVADPVLVATATVTSLIIPFIGTIIYTILRPPEFLADAREREIETQASELRMRHLTAQSCPRCEHPIERSWLRCPECQHRLKDPCVSCNRPVDPRWAVCPYCETPLRSEEEAPRRRSRSRSSSGTPAARQPAGTEPAAPRKTTSTRRSNASTLEPAAGFDIGGRGAHEAQRAPAARRAAARRRAAGRRRRHRPAPALDDVLLSPDRTRPRDPRGPHMSENVPHPDPRQARRLRARPHRRGARPVRAQGPRADRPEADHRRRGDRPRALRRAHRASRSSASWSTSSPAARWSPRCSRASKPSRPPVS